MNWLLTVNYYDSHFYIRDPYTRQAFGTKPMNAG